MRTYRFSSSAEGLGTLPPIPSLRYPTPLILYPWIPYLPDTLSLDTLPPEGTWDHRYPTPQKGPGTSDTLTPCEQTHTSKNITFPQLRWWVIIIMLLSVLGLGIDGHT